MNFIKEFNEIMEGSINIALATAVDNIPNVRILNFYYNPENKGIVYFSSFKSNPKTLEFSKNSTVAFTTVPVSIENTKHVRCINATVQKSKLTIYDLKDAFISKMPSYEMLIAQAGDMLDVYEIHLKEAVVILDPKNSGKLTF